MWWLSIVLLGVAEAAICSRECDCYMQKSDLLATVREFYVLNCTGNPQHVGNYSLADVLIYNDDHLMDTNILSTFYSLKSLVIEGAIESVISLPPMGSLRLLNVSRIPMSYLPENTLYRISVNLLILSLSHNNIDYLSDQAFDKLLALQHLDLSYNMIDRLPPDIFSKLSNLKTLDLSYNLLEHLAHEDLVSLKALSWLRIDANRIQTLESVRVPNPSVSLYMRHNPITKLSWNAEMDGEEVYLIDISYSSLPELNTYSFTNMNISKLIISNNPGLSVIDRHAFVDVSISELVVTGNPSLSYIDPEAFPNITIHSLNISNNGLKFLPQSLQEIDSIEVIEAVGNPLLCDCNLLWVKERINKGLVSPRITIASPTRTLVCSEGQSTLDVTEDPSSMVCPPRIVYHSKEKKQVDEGISTRLRCKVSGLPVPEVTWKYGGRQIPDDINIHQDNGDLLIDKSRSDNSGLYQCMVKNSQGILYQNYTLNVVEDDSRIIIVKAGLDTVEFSWRITNTKYKYKAILIDVKNNSQSTFQLQQFPRSRHSQSFTITGLERGATYRVCLAFEDQDTVDSDRCQTVTTLTQADLQNRGITDYSLYGIITASVVSFIFILLIICVCVTSKSYVARKKKKEMQGMVSDSSYGLMTTSFSQRSHLSSMFDNPGANVNTPLTPLSNVSIMLGTPGYNYKLKRTISDPLLSCSTPS